VVALCTAAAVAAIGCERRRDIPAVGDASTTAATEPAPRGERPLEPAADAGEQAAIPEPLGPAPGPRPVAEDDRQRARERRLERATLTIVQAADRDRNLGIVTAAPSRIEVDAGSCEVGIEIKRGP
jgi:hypothetical protein